MVQRNAGDILGDTLVRRNSGNAQERKALDAGCGVGGNLRWLESYVPREQIYGIDIDSDACSFVPQPYHSRVTQSSVTSLPFEDNSFDFVTSFDVLVQVPGAEGEKQAVQEMLRVLKPEGVLFIRCAAYSWLFSDHDRSLHTQRRYSLTELVTLLTDSGFAIRYSTYANFFLLPVAIFSRLILKPLGAVRSGSDVRDPGRVLNFLFGIPLGLEAWILRLGLRFPAGLSAIVVATKSRKS